MPEKQDGSGPTPASEEATEMSTPTQTGTKLSKIQTGLLMFALCVRSLNYSVTALITNQPVLRFPRGPGCHHYHDSASNHLGPFPLILGLRLGRCSLHAYRWGINTSLG